MALGNKTNMNKKTSFNEFDFLDIFYQAMLKEGVKHNLIRITLDHRTIEDIYETTSYSATEDEIQKLIDICLANNWLEQKTIGVGQYNNLQLTTTGLGVVTSKRRQKENENQKTFMKKTSEYIEDHKGLFLLFGFIIAAAGLILNYLKE